MVVIILLSIGYYVRFKSFYVAMSTVYVPFLVYDYPEIFRFTK